MGIWQPCILNFEYPDLEQIHGVPKVIVLRAKKYLSDMMFLLNDITNVVLIAGLAAAP
jgi:hypothetical protein